MEIGDKVIDFGRLQNFGEGWHLAPTLNDLRSDLRFVECATYSR